MKFKLQCSSKGRVWTLLEWKTRWQRIPYSKYEKPVTKFYPIFKGGITDVLRMLKRREWGWETDKEKLFRCHRCFSTANTIIGCEECGDRGC